MINWLAYSAAFMFGWILGIIIYAFIKKYDEKE